MQFFCVCEEHVTFHYEVILRSRNLAAWSCHTEVIQS